MDIFFIKFFLERYWKCLCKKSYLLRCKKKISKKLTITYAEEAKYRFRAFSCLVRSWVMNQPQICTKFWWELVEVVRRQHKNFQTLLGIWSRFMGSQTLAILVKNRHFCQVQPNVLETPPNLIKLGIPIKPDLKISIPRSKMFITSLSAHYDVIKTRN